MRHGNVGRLDLSHFIGGRVLLILHAYKVFRPDVLGGAVEAIAAIASGLRTRHHSQILVCRLQGEARLHADNGIPVEAVGTLRTLLSMPVAPRYPSTFRRRARDVDLVALHHPFPLNDLGVALQIPRNVAVVVHWHAEILGRNLFAPLIGPLLRNTLRRADYIIVSDESMIASSPYLRAVAQKCVVIPFGINVEDWANLTDAERSKAEALRLTHPRMIVATGRLVPYKGFEVLIRAMQSVDGIAFIIGEGNLGPRLARLASDLGVTDRVHFAGRLSHSDLKVHLHAAKLFAFPSVSIAETFGIAQLEAMAAGLPIVNTDLPTGVPRVARHEREALTVPTGDAAALAAAMSRILSDESLRSRLARASVSRAQHNYSMTSFVEHVEATYEAAALSRKRFKRADQERGES